jgi:predicted phosphodiesterase
MQKSRSSYLRAIVPDSHGSEIDVAARDAFLDDLKQIDPKEIVMLGDHVDVGGIFSTHQRSYIEELRYSYEDDLSAAADFLDEIQKRAPRATVHFLQGNHEAHAERWVARTFYHAKDARAVNNLLSPEKRLRLKTRGIKYYNSQGQHHGLSTRGTIKLGKCYFTHGISAAKQAASVHLDAFGACVVFGHVHRAQSEVRRTLAAEEIGAWCPGTLAKLQPLYLHTGVSRWSHGYAIQFVNPSGTFLHVQVPIVKGKSMLKPLVARLAA